MMRLKEKGFTLVEIMIVVAIIAILSAIAIPNFMTARSKSRANACRANLRQLESAVEQYAMDNTLADQASCSMTLIIPTYIKKTPQCQAGGTYGNSPAGGAGPVSNDVFVVGGTPWCTIGATPASGGYAHVLYQQ